MKTRMLVTRTVPAVVVVMLALTMAACGGDDASPWGGATSTTAASATSAAVATTETPTTTAATTTSPTTTAPTTTAVVSSTLGPPPLPLVFLPDGLNIVDFGASPEDAVFVVGTYLGLAPTDDSGWGPAWGDYGACPGTEYRQVEFGSLILMFTDADIFQPAGTRHFFAWSYNGDPPGVTPGPLDLGTTLAALQALYPAVAIFGGDPIFGDTFRFDGPGGEQLWGRLTGTAPADTITFLTGGWGCGE